jgi:hypothetical protein
VLTFSSWSVKALAPLDYPTFSRTESFLLGRGNDSALGPYNFLGFRPAVLDGFWAGCVLTIAVRRKPVSGRADSFLRQSVKESISSFFEKTDRWCHASSGTNPLCVLDEKADVEGIQKPNTLISNGCVSQKT